MLRTQITNALNLKFGIYIKPEFMLQFTHLMFAGESRVLRTGLHKITITRSERWPINYTIT